MSPETKRAVRHKAPVMIVSLRRKKRGLKLKPFLLEPTQE
jgi:hypothetical protein